MTQIFVLITTPLFTRILSTAEFGTFDFLTVIFGNLSVLLSLGLVSGLFRYYYDISEEQIVEKQKMVSSLLLFIVSIGIIVIIGFKK